MSRGIVQGYLNKSPTVPRNFNHLKLWGSFFVLYLDDLINHAVSGVILPILAIINSFMIVCSFYG